jgi:20S proteasome alpha/beta subunit
MTIAAGFWVSDGVLLCADTQYTGGMRVYENKIFGLTLSGKGACSVHIALAGHDGTCKMAVEDCFEAIEGIPAGHRNYATVKGKIRSAVKALHDGYAKTNANKRFQLMVALWMKADNKLRLMRTQGDTVSSVPRYDCVGCGEYLGHYLLRPAYRSAMSTAHGVLIAVNALSAIKRYDASCGGYSDLRLVRPDGTHIAVTGYDLSKAEAYIAQCEKVAWQFGFNIGNPLIDGNTFQRNCHTFTSLAVEIRKQMRSSQGGWESVLKALGISFRLESQSPE